ncbi:MAG: capsule assembly Wzi family protein [Anaeromyxobacteraceae bacterium]
MSERWLPLVAAALLAGPGAAMAAEDRPLPKFGVSALLPTDHWAVRAAVRLDGVGLVTGWLPASQAAPMYMVWAALEEGARRAETERPAMAALAKGWKEKFQQEWRGIDEKGLWRFVGGQASAGYQWNGLTPAPPETPPAFWSLTPPHESAPFVAAEAAGAISDYLALQAVVAATTDEVTWAGALVTGVGPVSLSVGRVPGQTGFAAPGGGVVIGGGNLRDQVEFQIFRPVDIYIGLLSFDLSLGLLRPPHHDYGTLLWQWSLQYQPVPRLTFSIQSGVMMGSETWEQATGSPFTWKDFAKAITYRGNGTENNVYSVAGRYRLPTEDWVPVTLYLDWGGDDNGGAWYSAPGIDAGFLVPSLPFAPEVSVGFEWSFFGTVCQPGAPEGGLCRPPDMGLNWYTHGYYSWTRGDLPLGHRMGGNGREYLLYAAADLLDARLLLRGDVFLRDRFSGNLYAPYTGKTGGFDAQATWRIGIGEVGVSGSLETGGGWTTGGAGAHARVFF